MCGIAGLYNFGAGPRDERAAVTAMRDAMSHRGPDDAGLWASPDSRVVLAHRRLSIVDLSAAGHQPMSNEDGAVWVTFNGEIYNHADLRPGLEAKGHKFRSRTDTEAIVHQYEETGEDCLSSLDGMFALGIWDAARDRLVLARDRLGKKPLYYTVIGGRLLFASEIKGLLAHPDVRRDIDPEGLNLYLTFGNVPAPHTLFLGIKKLPAAHRLICDRLGHMRVERYWSAVPETPWPAYIGEAEAVARVRELLESAVKKRLMADVPVGAFLSGGVDSSANVALMSRLIDRPLQTYSVGFEGFGPKENFHDLPYAQRVAKQFGCDHHELSVTADECRGLPARAGLPAGRADRRPRLPAHALPLPPGAARRRHRRARRRGQRRGVRRLRRHGPHPQRRRPALGADQAAAALRARGLHEASRLLGQPAGRTDVLRRARDGHPLYWGLDVVFGTTRSRTC